MADESLDVDYDSLPSDAIKLGIEYDSNVQLEILLDNAHCKIDLQQPGSEKQELIFDLSLPTFVL